MRAVVVGEALLDVVVRPDGSVAERPGGSPLNVAVGLARLGVPTTLLTSYGEDDRGRSLRAHLVASGVEPMVVPGPTSVARAVLDDEGRATYDFSFHWELGATALPAADLVHVGSLAAVAGDAVTRLLQEHRGQSLVSYDPNCRPGAMGPVADVRPRVERLVAMADVVKASDEDLAFLYDGEQPLAVAQRWLGSGARMVVVTSGAEGADCWTTDDHRHVPVPTGDPVVDTVGAGDAFMAGLLWGLLTGRDDPLASAAAVARRTCERVGADPPTAVELGL